MFLTFFCGFQLSSLTAKSAVHNENCTKGTGALGKACAVEYVSALVSGLRTSNLSTKHQHMHLNRLHDLHRSFISFLLLVSFSSSSRRLLFLHWSSLQASSSNSENPPPAPARWLSLPSWSSLLSISSTRLRWLDPPNFADKSPAAGTKSVSTEYCTFPLPATHPMPCVVGLPRCTPSLTGPFGAGADLTVSMRCVLNGSIDAQLRGYVRLYSLS